MGLQRPKMSTQAGLRSLDDMHRPAEPHMTDSAKTPDLASQGNLASRRDQMFPLLNAAQLARLQRYGQRRALRAGEILAEPGDRGLPMWVVLSGGSAGVQVGMNSEAGGG